MHVNLLFKKIAALIPCLLLTVALNAQTVTKAFRSVPLKTVLEEVERQTGYSILFENEDVDVSRPVTATFKDATLQTVLDTVLDKSLRYTVKGGGKLVTISRRSPVSAPTAPNGEMTVAGTVISSADNQPIVGANIYVEGTNVGTTTDAGGNYKLTVPASAKTVTVSFLGYDTKKISVRDIHLFKLITLADASNKLEDVVVVGFGVQKKESLVGAVQSVKPSDLQTSSSNLSTSFSGKIAGVIAVQKSGEPGADGASFWIRGISTFGSGQSPLLILDGVEITNQMLNNIPPETIESFSVLKDATATALYGSRGANGVMIITTKNGRDSEKMTINLRAEFGASAPTRVPKVADGITYMETFNEARTTRGEKPYYSNEKIMGTKLGLDPYVYPNVDWYDMLFKDCTFNQNFNFNMTGGAKKIDYFLNASVYNENGIMRKPEASKFDTNINAQKYLFQANVSADATKTTRVSLKMNTQLHYRHAPIQSVSDLFAYAMTGMPCEFPATLPGEESDTFVRFGTNNAWNSGFFTNPYAQLCRGYGDQFRGHFTSALTVNQNLDFITKGLSATGMATFYNRVYSAVYRSFTPFMYQLTDYNIDEAGNYSYTSNSTNTGTTYLGTTRGKDGYRELAFQAKIDYARTFGKHDVGATIVYMQKERNMNISDEQEYAALPYRQQGLAGRVTYGFDKRYLFEANFGYNGSENFAAGKRFGFFPSVAVGWVISNEPFWKGIKEQVNLFKLRASYGLVGNDVISKDYADRFPYLTTVDMGQGYDVYIGNNFERKYGPILSVYGNPNATWEESRKLDIGVEIGLFDSLNIIFDWFKEKRSGIFMQRTSLPSTFGMSGITPWANIGKVDNSGVDISVDYNKAFSKDLILSLRGTFTYAHNEIVEMDEPKYKWAYQYKAGHPINSIQCLIAEGLFRDEEEIASSPSQDIYATTYPIRPGDVKYRDLNDDKIIDDNDMCWTGNPTVPEIIYGFGFSLKYKGFDCSAFFQGQGKVSILMYNYHPFATAATPGSGLMQWIADEHWSEDDPNPKALYPRLSPLWNNNNTKASTLYVRNGKMLRLKTAEIGYTYKKMRVYVSGTNLLTFAPFKYWDPEKGSGNGLGYPLQRTYNLGFQFNF
ncbi:MAG: SusC/RagA family TonB-linked outer membrane protein [Alistipes sp.]|uniref:SusC/RagA family TonB-linked outer membrane protein n=1 Tax=Alistipes sp. TaxID=1872444 RepID=UPI00283DF568|nr:SusC/RagA family TonB-linked outer membrane protein [Alistipes sp.]MDR3939792.1 SusC/RagA family TonB-linked outer membrane protein [Alistipes sp.]